MRARFGVVGRAAASRLGRGPAGRSLGTSTPSLQPRTSSGSREVVVEVDSGPESAGWSQTPSTSPMMIATTDSRTTMAAIHHCRSPRLPLPGGITTGKPTTSHPDQPFSDKDPPGCALPVGFAVSGRGPRRQENPRPAGAGSANPGFYAESGYHSVRERTPGVNPQNMASHLSGPLAKVATIPPGTPASAPGPRTGQGRGCRHICSPVGRRGKPAWGASPPSALCDS